jgi:acetyl/propionyl-CoA carboxylase alpha subunit
MQRALGEYDVRGIRTSVEFFRWMLRQPAFLKADVHTGLLDELLQQRHGTPFSERDPSLEEVALVAAAVHAASARSRPRGTDARSGGPSAFAQASADRSGPPAEALAGRDRAASWKSQGRLEGLRR